MAIVHRPLNALPLEGQILFMCAGGVQNDPPLAHLLSSPIDWDRLLWLAELERALPTVPRRLARVVRHPLPETGRRMEQLALVWEFRMRHLQERVKESLAALRAAGIVPVLLKGAALACTVYNAFADRPMSDIDMLVPPADAERAREILLSNGWRWRRDLMPEARYALHHHLPPIEDASGTGVHLELHTDLFVSGHPFPLDGDAVRSTARAATLDGEPCLVPTLPDQLMHACLHFAWSNEMRVGAWRTFRDLDTIAATGRMDWDAFVKQARERRASSACYWSFRLARSLSGVPIPTSVIAALRPSLPEAVLRRLELHFVLQMLPTENACPSEALSRAVWALGIQPKRNGHDGVRPWDHDTAPRQPVADLTVMDKSTRHLRNLRGWTSYFRSVITA